MEGVGDSEHADAAGATDADRDLLTGPQPIALRGTAGGEPLSLYDAVGGHPTFERLVSGFYARVSVDPGLRRIYPDHDWAGAAERLMLFLEQYFGGPSTYSETRGHPRLRRRHVHFRIDAAARDAWLAHMRAALDDVALAPEADAEIWGYLQTAAEMFVNVPDSPGG
jgi:hemoglobin